MQKFLSEFGSYIWINCRAIESMIEKESCQFSAGEETFIGPCTIVTLRSGKTYNINATPDQLIGFM